MLAALLEELRTYPGGEARHDGPTDIAVELKLKAGERTLSFLSMTTVFGTPLDITLSELAIEAFLPADGRRRRRSEFPEKESPGRLGAGGATGRSACPPHFLGKRVDGDRDTCCVPNGANGGIRAFHGFGN